MMFRDYDFLDRFSVAADAGFSGVKILFSYEFEADKMDALLDLNQLKLCLLNLFPRARDKGERGFGALPKREAFYNSVDLALKYARDMDATAVHMMAGIAAPNDQNRRCYIDNAGYAADLVGEVGKTLLLEPISEPTISGYFLNSTWQAAHLIDEIAHPAVKLQLDISHHEITHGDVLNAITRLFDRIGHMQISGVPDRHAPDICYLDYRAIQSHINSL